MKIGARFDHFNIDVQNLERSIAFYEKALGLHVIREREAEDGSYKIVFMGDDATNFALELTWLRDHADRPWDLGENESHLCLRVEGDYEELREYYREMGCLCYENHKMNLYFINDPDDYWIEILPLKR